MGERGGAESSRGPSPIYHTASHDPQGRSREVHSDERGRGAKLGEGENKRIWRISKVGPGPGLRWKTGCFLPGFHRYHPYSGVVMCECYNRPTLDWPLDVSLLQAPTPRKIAPYMSSKAPKNVTDALPSRRTAAIEAKKGFTSRRSRLHL